MPKKTTKKQKSVFAQNIIARRKSMGWTQDDLAARVGLHKNAIVAIENDKSGGTLPTRQAIADAFQCSLESLYSPPSRPLSNQFEHSKATPLSDHIVNDGLTPHDVGPIISALHMASPARRALILAVLFDDDSFVDGFPDLAPIVSQNAAKSS